MWLASCPSIDRLIECLHPMEHDIYIGDGGSVQSANGFGYNYSQNLTVVIKAVHPAIGWLN